MQQHYFHSSINLESNRRNLHRFRMSTKSQNLTQYAKNSIQIESENHLCLSNGNTIEIYKISSQSVDLCVRKQFMCNIVKLQVIPSLHHDSDYIFILDELGRYAFWKPNQPSKQICNITKVEDVKKRYYRESLSPQQQQRFSGSSFRYDVKDTVGHVFFTIQNKLTVLNVTVKAKEGLKVQNMRTYEIPYTRFRFINCLQPFNSTKESEIIIGIVQQIEQKTVLKFHTLDVSISSIMVDQQSLSFKLQKVNILQFSSGEFDEIILLSYDEISLYRYKNNNHLCNYRTKGNYGSACYIPPVQNKKRNQAVYIHLGYQLTSFTKTKYLNYGPLKLENQILLENRGIQESKYLGKNYHGQILIGFVTTFNEVYIVGLKDEEWTLIRKINSLSSIFSINQIDSKNPKSPLIVVHSASQSCSEVSLVQISTPSVLQMQQCISGKVIENIEVIQQGESLIVSYSGESSLLTWSNNEKKWVQHFNFRNQTKEQVLACKGIYIVMRSGIYKYKLSSQGSSSLSTILIVNQENILCAVCNDSYIGYYTSEGTFKFFEMKTEQIARMRKNCMEEYLWHMIEDEDVIVSAAYSEPGELRILPVHKSGRKVNLQTKELVSSIISIRHDGNQNSCMQIESIQEQIGRDTKLLVDLVIGYHNGQVQIYSLAQNKVLKKFNIGNQMVKMTPYRQGYVILYTNQKQFILSRQTGLKNSLQYKINQVQLSPNDMEHNLCLRYLPRFQKFLIYFTKNASQTENKQANQHDNSIKSSTFLQLRSLKLSHSLNINQLNLQLNSAMSLKTIFKAESNDTIPYTEIHGQFLFIAVSQNLFKYSLKSNSFIKQQLHLLKQVIAINILKSGLIVVGIDFMQSGSIYVFDFQDLTIKSSLKMGASSYPTSLQTFKSPISNKFLIRHESFVSIYELETNEIINLLKTINTKTEGSTLELNQKYSKLLLTDPYQYLSVWEYDLESKDVLPVSKYFGPYLINDCAWLDGAVVTGDRGGNITILQFNLQNSHDLLKMQMTKVAQISIGEEVFTLKKSKDDSKVYYGTQSGSIGILRTISEKQFKLLKQIEQDALKSIDLKQQFSYEQWRKRLPQNDKVIDSVLIKYYLDEFRNKKKANQQQFYLNVKKVYEDIITKIN